MLIKVDEYSRFTRRLIQVELRRLSRLPSVLGMALLLTFVFGCTQGSPGGQRDTAGPTSQETPELTKELIDERINDTRVWDVPPESGTGEPIPWSFDEDEPKKITVIDKQMDGTRATIVLDIETESSPRARNRRQHAGQIRTEWHLETGWVLRRWEIVNTENISMKYKALPKLPAANSNR